MRQLLVGIDVGTTYCKALVLDAEGEELGEARERTPWTPVATGAELDPRAIAGTALAVASRALAESPAGEVAAVGIAGTAEAGVLLDRRGEPTGPVIAWHDVRGTDEARALGDEIGWFSATTGLPASPLCSLASRTGLLSLRDGEWWGEAPAWLGVPEDFLAELVPAGTPIGRVGDTLPAARGAAVLAGSAVVDVVGSR